MSVNKQSGVSSLLAAAASFVVIGMVAVGSAAPASAASEEDLAAPHGSFVSSMSAPNDLENLIYYVPGTDKPVVILASEEDAAVPPGAFTSIMVAPELGAKVKVAGNYDVNLSEIVASGLE